MEQTWRKRLEVSFGLRLDAEAEFGGYRRSD